MRPAGLVLLLCLTLPARAPGQTPERLSLVEAIRLATRSNAGAVAAGFQADAAEARTRQRRSALLPNLSASVVESGVTSNTATFGFDFPAPAGQPPVFDPQGEILGPVRTLDARARLTQSLFDPAARGRVRTATSAAEAVRATAGAVAEEAGTFAGLTYLQVLRSEAVLDARLADSALADSLVRIAAERLEAGTAVALDVTRARAQTAAVRAQVIVARSQLEHDRMALAHGLGLPVESPLVLTDSLAEPARLPPVGDLDSVVAAALTARPDVAAADAALRATEQSLAAIRAERLPSLGLFGNYGLIGRNGRNYLGTYLWGVAVSVPLFDGFMREGRLDEDQARLLELERRRRDLADRVALEVRSAALDLAAAFESVTATGDRLDLGLSEARQSTERFEAGLDNNADVITALLALNAARVARIDALTAYHRARIALARARGSVTELP